MDIIDQRDGLIEHREKMAKAFYTGSWGCGRKVENLAFAGLCLNVLDEMIGWNEPITWDEYRDMVCEQEKQK